MRKTDTKTLWILFSIFFKAGTFTFGGGLAMLPVIKDEICGKYKLMEYDDFMEYATLSQTLPGVIALNCASFVGLRVAGAAGMFVAGIGSVFSAFVLMVAATIALQYIPQEGPAMGAMQCIRTTSAALVFSAAVSLGRHNLKSLYAVVVMISAFVLVFILKVSVPLVILLAGIVGCFYRQYQLKKGGLA